ncbi:MAG: hypothetical protein JXX14_21135 [Deltaproteobacteria bacterium]|nr:hypothetical protein [Deltaproteobacteria bacterium]
MKYKTICSSMAIVRLYVLVLAAGFLTIGCWDPIEADNDAQSDTGSGAATDTSSSTFTDTIGGPSDSDSVSAGDSAASSDVDTISILDTSTETGTDSVTDTSLDTTTVTTSDSASDATVDTVSDSTSDTAADTASDTDTVDTEPACVPVDEVCDGEDNDCDGLIDEGTDEVAYSATVTCWVDADNDGVAVLSADVAHQCGTCDTGYTATEPAIDSADCDDSNADAYPGNTEVCNGADDDCDMLVDENSDGEEHGLAVSCWVDADGDGYAHIDAVMVKECGSCGANQVSVAPAEKTSDCNDENPNVNPGEIEVCDDFVVDEDCDGLSNPDCDCTPTVQVSCPQPGVCGDGKIICDGDGHWLECNVVATVEICNGLDDDCDGSVDEGVTTACYADADGDGYAVAAAEVSNVCGSCPTATTSIAPGANTTDCDDSDPNIRPGGDEICNLKDDDCDGLNDETGSTNYALRTTCYSDADGDGFAISGAAPNNGFCGDCPSGYTDLEPTDATNSDCEDSKTEGADIYPGQTTYFREPYCTTAADYNATTENCCPKEQTFCLIDTKNPPHVTYDYNCNGKQDLAPDEPYQCYPAGCKVFLCDCNWVWDVVIGPHSCDDTGKNTAITRGESVSAACR